MDKIIIKGLEVFAYHGVYADEKQNGQPFLVDLTLYADFSKAASSDRLEDTINYAAVRECLTLALTGERYNLIERAAEVAAKAVFDQFPKVQKIKLRLKKPQAPLDCKFDYVAVEITRERNR
ncbi:MAG TPA: dihydroneopterin aldolase [Clostridiales bacterium]|nr:dihydroneopterin aldolase [Clostridiales bacterium]